MKTLIRSLPVLAVAAFLAGCEGPCTKIDTINGPKLTSGSADFSAVAALGTSVGAGYQSGGLVNRHQVHSYPALFAQQVGLSVVADGSGQFSFSGINNDGIPTLLEIKSLSPLVISNEGRDSGAPENQAQATDYHNLSVPGQLAFDAVDSTYYGFGPTPVHSNVTMFNIVYRHRGLGIQQLVRRAPSFVMVELGVNEVLGAAISGNANVFPVNGYIASITGVLDAIHAGLPNAKIAVFNVPGVTSIPFCTTFPPLTISLATGTPVSLIGPDGPLTPSDLVLLPAVDSLAVGRGIPVNGYNYVNPSAPGNGLPLLDSQVLNDSEQETILAAITQMNAALDGLVAARPWTVKVDLNALLAGIAANGYTLGATTYTTDFVTGGIFSLDGVHPNDMAHAIICNTMIDAVNAKWGATLPRLNVASYATTTSSRMRPAGAEKTYPVEVGGLAERLRALFPSRN